MPDFETVKSWQAEAVKGLENALGRNHLPHAIVLISPGDVGEKELAEQLATTLVCESPGPGLAPCGRCSSCHLRSVGTHPDVYYVRPEGRMRSISQEAMGEMMGSLQVKSLKGGAKVVIIEQAEALNKESANKFLKTLEEPSALTYFILQTKRGERLLPTIRSRCQSIRLKPLSRQAMIAMCQEELGLDVSMAELVAGLSRGRRNRARELAPQMQDYRRDVADALEIYSLREAPLEAARAFAQAKYKLMREKRDFCEDETSKAKKKLADELKDADPNVRKVELQKLEDNLVIANAEEIQDMRASVYEMLLGLWRDIWLAKKNACPEILHAFAAPQIERVASLYDEDEILRNIAEIELVRGPAVYLATQFDIVLQGLFARQTAPIDAATPLRRAIAATGL